MTKKVSLVTGGAGFIGSHLCKALLAKGHRVISLDNYFSGNISNIAPLLQNPDFEAIEHDVTSPFDIAADEIYNLACPASPRHYQNDPVKTVMTNVQGAIHALELAHARNIPILQASTSEVYGDPEVDPQSESYHGCVNPIGPRACYDEGKRCAETLFFDFWREKKVRIKVVRIFNTYGPNMDRDDGRVISNFVVQALSGADITLYGDGSQTRSFCYVDDMVPALIAMMETDASVTGPVNLGNPETISVADLARKIIAATGSASQLVTKPLPQDDPKRRCPDIARAKALLNWQPSTNLDVGLERTIAYFKTILVQG